MTMQQNSSAMHWLENMIGKGVVINGEAIEDILNETYCIGWGDHLDMLLDVG